MESALGHECVYLAAFDADELVGVLPLVRVKSLLFGHYLVSMPFLNYGGPLGTPAAVDALAEHASGLARESAVKLLQVRNRTPLSIDWPVGLHKVATILDLPADEDVLWKSFPGKVRTDIRRPDKEGVSVSFGPERLDDFHYVFAHHMRDLGTPTHSRELFASILEQFPDSALVGCAYYEGRPVACGFGFIWDDEFEMTWASALREHKRLRANMGLYWAFMQEAIRRGARRFNFGRSTPNSGTHAFKLQWGSVDQPLHWYYRSRSGVQGAPSPQDEAYAWGPRIWRKLPVAVATALGPRVVRYIP